MDTAKLAPNPRYPPIFGVHLFPYLDAAWEYFTGKKASEFNFVIGKTPMSTWPELLTMIVLYYSVIFTGQRLMKDRKPYELNFLFQIHNLALVIISLALLLLLAEEILVPWNRYGFYWCLCSAKNYHSQLVAIYYLNYIIKFVELLDTVFLFLKKKPMQPLHTYHHGATAFLCFTQLRGYTSPQFVPIGLNLWVHVLMYFYYFLAARKIRVPWKQWVTRFQIIQFIIDLFVVYFATYNQLSYESGLLPSYGACNGTHTAAFIGCFILSSYLLLFIDFYKDTYNKRKSSNKSKTASKNGTKASIGDKEAVDVEPKRTPRTRSRKL